MKSISTLIKGLCMSLTLLFAVAIKASAQITISPTNAVIANGQSITFTVNTSDGGGGWSDDDNRTFVYTITGGTTSPASGASFNCTSGCHEESHSFTFSSAGTYTVTVTVTRTQGGGGGNTRTVSTNVTVFTPNLYSTSGTNDIEAYEVNPVTGAVINGPVDIEVPFGSTAGLGKNRVNTNDAEGNLYYILNTSSNNGVVQIYSVRPDGSTDVSVGSIDMNGASNASLGFVRLGFASNGRGWIIAGDGGAAIFIASFQGNGNSPISNVTAFTTPLTVSGGSAAEFQNGDLAIGPNNVLYAMANVTGGQTYIYTLNSLTTPTTLTRKWTVQTSGGIFTGTTVNGIAWTQTGSLHISTGNGIYFVDQTSINSTAATVQATLVLNKTGLTDLASSEFPTQSTLPVTFGGLNVKKAGANADVSWTTLAEINNSHFIVERSDDGASFKAVGKVNSKQNGNSVQNYNFLDPINATATVIYYRIKQVDVDGSTSFSATVALRLGNNTMRRLSTYPNPFINSIRVEIESGKTEDVMLRINSVTGQTIITKRINLQRGNNVINVDNLETLKKGMYIMELVSSEGSKTVQLIKN